MTSTQPSTVRGASVMMLLSWQLVQTMTTTALPGASGSLSVPACAPTAFAVESAKQISAIGINKVTRRSVFIGTNDNAPQRPTSNSKSFWELGMAAWELGIDAPSSGG